MVARAVAILAAALALVAVAWSPPLDDFWLTLASGRAILGGADPGRALPFTHTAMQPGAINPQWGAQVVLAAPGSLEIALALSAAFVFAGLLVTYVRGLARASLVASTVALLLALAVLGPHLVPRAQSFSILLLPIALLLLELAGRRWWLPLAYGLLVVAWANLHGAFILAPLVAGLWLLGRLVSGGRLRDELPVLVTVALAVVAPLLNPAGATLYAYALGQAGNPAVRALATEWQPAWPWTGFGAALWLFAIGLLLGQPWRRWPDRASELLVLAALLVLGATAVRSIPWFVLAATPLFAEQIDAALRRWVPLRRALGPIPLSRAIALDLAASVALVGILFQLVRPGLPAPIARLTPTMPVALVDHLEANLPLANREPLFNSQAWGGYLAYRLGDRAATYLDGRIETPTAETWNRYLAIANGANDAIELLSASDVDWAFVETWQTGLRQRLLDAGWEEMADAPVGWLLRRPSG